MLLIINLSSPGVFPVESLKEVDIALAGVGFKREIHSVIEPGKVFSATYNGPRVEKSRLEAVLNPIARKHAICFTIEYEESVSFP